MELMYKLNSDYFTNEQKKSIEHCLEKNLTWLIDNFDNWVKDELIPEVSKMIKVGYILEKIKSGYSPDFLL